MAGVIIFCFLPRLVVPALLAWLVQSTLAAQPENAGGCKGGATSAACFWRHFNLC
jgi:hypothetical protein